LHFQLNIGKTRVDPTPYFTSNNNNMSNLPSLVVPDAFKPTLYAFIQKQRPDVTDPEKWLQDYGFPIVMYNLGTQGKAEIIDSVFTLHYPQSTVPFNLWTWITNTKLLFDIFDQYNPIAPVSVGYDIAGIRADAQDILDKTK
jgi:hypothetical protein